MSKAEVTVMIFAVAAYVLLVWPRKDPPAK